MPRVAEVLRAPKVAGKVERVGEKAAGVKRRRQEPRACELEEAAEIVKHDDAGFPRVVAHRLGGDRRRARHVEGVAALDRDTGDGRVRQRGEVGAPLRSPSHDGVEGVQDREGNRDRRHGWHLGRLIEAPPRARVDRRVGPGVLRVARRHADVVHAQGAAERAAAGSAIGADRALLLVERDEQRARREHAAHRRGDGEASTPPAPAHRPPRRIHVNTIPPSIVAAASCEGNRTSAPAGS